MGNSSIASLPTYSCSDANLSRNSVTPEYWESSSISDDYSANSTATAVIMLISLLIGLPANTIIIISIIYQKLYKETTHMLLLNLAISDLLVCVLVMPFIIVTGFSGEYVFGDSDYTRCQVCQTGLILIALTVFSVNVLGLISLDRFIFIKFPMRYEKVVTLNRVVVIVVITWALSIFESILPTFGFGEYKYAYSLLTCTLNLIGKSKNIYYGMFLVLLALIPITIIIITNIWTICIVRKQIRKVYRTRRSFGNREELKKYNEGLRKQIRKRRNRKQLVLIRAFGAILIGNFVAWTPTILQVVLLFVVDPELIPLGMYSFALLTYVMHSVLHPLIEGCFIPEIRRTFKFALGIMLCQKLKKKAHAQLEISMTSFKTTDTAITIDTELDSAITTEDTKQSSCQNCDMCGFLFIDLGK